MSNKLLTPGTFSISVEELLESLSELELLYDVSEGDCNDGLRLLFFPVVLEHDLNFPYQIVIGFLTKIRKSIFKMDKKKTIKILVEHIYY